MDLNSMNSRMSANSGANAQANRAAATANPEFDAGMGDDVFDTFDDIDTGGAFGVSDGLGGGDPFGSDPFAPMGSSPMGGQGSFNSDPFGSAGNFGMNFGPTPQQQSAQTGQSPEDKFFEVAGKAGKASMGFFKELTQAFKTSTAIQRANWGRYSLVMGIICAIVGVLLWIFTGKFAGCEILVGSVVSIGTGIIVLCYAQSAISNTPPAPQEQPQQAQFTPDFGFDGANAGANSTDDWGNDWDEGSDGASWDDDASSLDEQPQETQASSTDDDWGNDWGSDWNTPTATSEPVSDQADFESATAALDNIQSNGLYDRRSLFERQLSVLSNITKDYATQTVIAEGTETFNNLDALVQESGELFKTGNTNEIPYLISAVDTLFYIRLEIARPKYIKNVDAYTQEIVNIFQYDRATGKRDTSIYGVGEFVGKNIYIKLMKGETAFIGLKDIYNSHSDKILDYNNKMPIVIGVDIEGSPVIEDFYKLDSILITGMPRSGKTWLMLAILYQMMCYMSPDELQFYIMDPKAKLSDFAHAITPHIRNFITDDDDILAQLKYIVRVEGPRRKEIIGSAGYVNILDYNKDNPDKAMPFLYVIIDEVVTLAERMEKETLKEFQGLLFELVSQLPAAGIRIFMVPHLVKDAIIKKNTTSLINCRVSVCGNAEHIESSCGVKNFPHSLLHTGDTCTVLKGYPEAMFIHSVALAKTNEENKKLFSYLGDLWAKICPDSVAGSVYEIIKNGGSVLDAAANAKKALMQATGDTAPANAPKRKSKTSSAQQGTMAVNQHRQAVQSADAAWGEADFANNTADDWGAMQDDSQDWGNNDITLNGDDIDLFDDDL